MSHHIAGTMSSAPLALPEVHRRAERLFADKTIATPGPQGFVHITYAESAERTRRLGGALNALGLAADARVGTFAWNTARHFELYFAVPCTGRVLHTINIRLAADDIAWIVNHAEDEVIFADASLVQLLLPILDDLPTVRHVVVMREDDEPLPSDPRFLDYEQLLSAAEPADFHVDDEHRAAAMCYTSGTTGRPKGVVYTHRSIVLHSLAVMAAGSLGVCETDVLLPIVPMFHVNAWGIPHGAAMAGASLVMPGADLSGPALATLLERERVTFAAGVPTIWQNVLPELEGRDLSALRALVSGGAPMPLELSDAYAERTGIPLTQAWGMTETSPTGSVCQVKSTLAGETPEQRRSRRTTIGVPVPLVSVRIMDPESGEERPWDGEARGELEITGPFITASYYRHDDASRFSEDGWLRTGDVAQIDEHGYVRLVDRIKDLVKSGGEWISSVELENAIMAHPDVREAAVIAVPDERWGERPMAFVVRAEDASLEADEIRAFLADRVARWWIPEHLATPA